MGACMVVGAAAADEQNDGSFALPRDVVQAATAFQSYMASAAKIDAASPTAKGWSGPQGRLRPTSRRSWKRA